MDHIRIDVRDHVGTLTLDRPEQGNAIDLPVARALLQAVEQMLADDDVHVLVLAGAGRHFCVGGDVHAMVETSSAWVGHVVDAVNAAVLLLQDSPKTLIAAVQGAVAGGALSLALACDLVITASDARFVAAWGSIGLSPDGGGSWLLPRVVGPRRAAVMLNGATVLGADAMTWGLATEVVDEAELATRARDVALAVARGPWEALGESHRLARTSWGRELADQLTREREAIIRLRSENQELLEEYQARRRPR